MVGAENMTLETGFFHAERGYWQVTGEVSDDALSGYPAGTVEVALRPDANAQWDGAAWTAEPQDPAALLAAARAEAVIQMRGFIAAFLQPFVQNATLEEVASWPSKAAAARAFKAGTATAAQLNMLKVEADLYAVSLADHAAKVIRKADPYEPIIVSVTALRSLTEQAIAAATTPAEVAAALATAKARADAVIARLSGG
jgi:hypothetical protein